MQSRNVAREILQEAILSTFHPNELFINESGEKFQAQFESDLMSRLREKGWKLPAAGWFLSDVKDCGFKVKQGYQFNGKVRRIYKDGSLGRSMSQYQTLIFM